MKQQLLQKQFLELCAGFAKQSDAFGWETEEGKKLTTADFLYRTVKLQLVYRPREGVGIPPSTLYCCIYPDKNIPIYLHLPQILPLLDVGDFRAVYFPYIESAKRMDACFEALTDFLLQLLPTLENLGATGENRTMLINWISREAPNADPEEILQEGSELQEKYLAYLAALDTLWVIQYTHSKPWYQYLLGNREAALKLYRSQKNPSAYDIHLSAFLASPESEGYEPISDACFALRDKNRVSHGQDDILTMGLCALVLFAGFAAVLCLVMGLLQIISAWGTSCWFGAPWYFGAMLAALPAMFGGIALRRKLIPLLFPKTAAQKLEFDDIISDTPLVRKLSKTVFAITAAAAIVLIPVVSSSCVQLYEDHAVIHHSLFDHQSFTYDEVDAIYHIQSRYNDFGERIEFDSYVIATADGRLTDLYGFTSAEETREKALPIFLNAGLQVIELDSDRELPQTDPA